MKEMFLKLIERLDKQSQGPSSISLIKELADAGLVYTPKQMLDMTSKSNDKGGITAQEISLRKMEMDQQVALEQIRHNTSMELAKLGIDDKRTDAIGGIFEKLLKTGGRALAEGEMDELESKGQGFPNTQARSAVAEEKCPKCGNIILVPEPENARQIKCIHCGEDLDWNPANR